VTPRRRAVAPENNTCLPVGRIPFKGPTRFHLLANISACLGNKLIPREIYRWESLHRSGQELVCTLRQHVSDPTESTVTMNFLKHVKNRTDFPNGPIIALFTGAPPTKLQHPIIESSAAENS
jgi:hypothetical protein